MFQTNLIDLAEKIGWQKVNDDEGYSLYEYKKIVSKSEAISHLVKIITNPTDIEVYEILIALKNVLPYKLQKKINKIIRNVKVSSLPQIVEVICFLVDEYKQKTTYSKLQQYGEVVGVDIEKLGYSFQYDLPFKLQAEIISKIELNLPIEMAPAVGKIRKLEFKIAFVKNKAAKDNA